MSRVQFKLRWLMVAVAVCGLLFGAATLKARRDHFRHLASMHEFLGWGEQLVAFPFAAGPPLAPVAPQRLSLPNRFPSSRPDDEYVFVRQDDTDATNSPEASSVVWLDPIRRISSSTSAKAEWHAMLRVKYERATRFPWLSVEPDPPEPE